MLFMSAWTDRQTRPLLIAAGSLTVNLLFALAHGVLGLWSGSAWYLVLAAYYAILGVMRFTVLRLERRNIDGRRLLTVCGMMLMALSVVLGQSVVMSLLFDRATVHHEIVMIALATYTCIKVTLAAVKLIRSAKTPPLRALRSIACADAAASLVTMQRSMIVTFGGMDAAVVFNALTGCAACLFVLGMGIGLVRRK